MDTEPELQVAPARRRRRRLSFRMKIALAGLLGVAAAWLLPRGGGEAPAPSASLTPSDRPGVTAVQIPLASIPDGVTFRSMDGVRVFFSRRGTNLVTFLGVATSEEGGPIWWCPKNRWFEGAGPGPYYDVGGIVLRFSAPRNLDIVASQRAGETLTVFPHSVLKGAPAPAQTPHSLPFTPPCSASERVG